ncbi:MAG: RRM3/PIF1 helicase-like protein, partial [Bdellovibrionota bacterium]
SWNRSRFEPAVLKTIVRTQDREFLDVLNDVRQGQVTPRVRDFLNSRLLPAGQEFEGTRLFPRRDMVENFNLSRLNALPGTARTFETTYTGSDRHIQDLRKVAPVPEVLHLKENALVMLRQNDPQGRWVNGSLGTVAAIADHRLKIALWNGLEIELDKASFTLLDAEGMEVAAATNFPVNLAYATTIHKAQGMTLDKVLADLRNLWEPGQAYVALSRVRSPENLFLSGWTPSSIRMDGAVRDFYDALF